ncbi:MAG: GTPase Era [Bacteroidales bacterium]|nr:GTPase Era [Bacteroidales bacterium]
MNKSGFVNIIGNPNVGKSTLMNALVGEKLSIVTSKAQTTRHRIMGIVNGEDYQIVFSDTPGILKPSYELQEAMMNFVDTAIGDADIIIYVTDVYESSQKNKEYVDKLNLLSCPVIVVINKIDKLLTGKDNNPSAAESGEKKPQTIDALVEKWHTLVPKAEILPMSALNKINTDLLLNKIVSILPEQHAWYDRDVFTDKNLRFFASEILREKILENYSKEIPYCAEVVIENFIEEEELYSIEAVINVVRESQKGIIIGKKGAALKRVGTQARKDMEKFFEKKVFLKIFVKVDPSWRENKKELKRFGYIV